MKVVCGLGNPGPEYANTRHNVGWWVVDRACQEWRFPAFRRDGAVKRSEGRVANQTVQLLEPMTYMNRSGAALAPLSRSLDFDFSQDLLIVVDDAALDVGRIRLRSNGSSGGHNGLKSVEAVLRSREYPRLRVGVGQLPPGTDLADWVLSPFEPQDEESVRGLLPDLVAAIELWLVEGVEAAANRFNR
jgi:PTH1 family peptidyl-tRNA hydrolase